MGFRIANIHDYERFVAIDLGSHRVRAALYAIQEGKTQLQGYASVRQSKKNIHNGSIVDMQGVASIIEKAIYEACRDVADIPEDIILAFSPVVSITDILSSQYLREDPESPLSMDEIDMMIEKIEKTSLHRAKEKARTEYAIVYDDIRLISSTLTSISIDGKSVTNPVGLSGQHVRITVLNIYTLASEYNILRSIISSLKKNTISIVPVSLIFPKLVEKTEYVYEDNLYIDIGYTHVTMVSETRGEIRYLDSFPMGSKMLHDIVNDVYREFSHTEIEGLIMRKNPSQEDLQIRESLCREYFSYVIDTLLSVMAREDDSLRTKTLFVSGGLFSSKWIEDVFFEMLSESLGSLGQRLHLSHVQPHSRLSPEYLVTDGLAILGQELLHIKKDPIVRILRYTLYHYE